MSHSGHNVTRPRSLLVIVGGMIAWMGLVGGVLITTPEYHRALTMKEEPVEMTWQELVENGLTDNSYVRLVDVDLNHTNPLGVSSPAITDINAFATCSGNESTSEAPPQTDQPVAPGGPTLVGASSLTKIADCQPDATRLCLNQGRFQVEVDWRDFQDRTGSGEIAHDSDDSGLLFFFDPDNWEMLVKVLDGCDFNGNYWVFAAATTNGPSSQTTR